MKKIFNILLLTIFLGGFASCETDSDSNPVLNDAPTFTLNTPPSAENNVYDMSVAKTIELTCSQPNYGYPAAPKYTVQVSLDETFVNESDDAKANYISLSTVYTNADMQVSAAEINAAIIELWSYKSDKEFPQEAIPVYVRLAASINGSVGNSISNVIKLSNVLGNTKIDKLEPPTKIVLVGGMVGWDAWKPMVKTSGLNGEFWSLLYFNENDIFKFGTKQGEYIGYNDSRLTVNDKAEAGVSGLDDGFGGQNIQVAKAGWYVLYIKAKVIGKAYEFTMSFYPGEVYLFGATNGGKWEYGDYNKFTTPATKDGAFVSPALTAEGEPRMCVKTETDWWRTEFTIYNGDIFYREDNAINNNWKDDMGADYSLPGTSGNVISLFFTTGKGEMK